MPPGVTDEHPHHQLRKHIRTEDNAETLLSIHILEYEWYEGDAGRRLVSAPNIHVISPFIQFGTVLLWDGVVEILGDEVASAISNADREAAVGFGSIVFEVGNEGWGDGHAVDPEAGVPNSAVSLVVESWRGFGGGRRLAA